jgi:putative transposase
MREQFTKVGISTLCGLFGKSRQAWYEASWDGQEQLIQDSIVIELVMFFRKQMPRVGG